MPHLNVHSETNQTTRSQQLPRGKRAGRRKQRQIKTIVTQVSTRSKNKHDVANGVNKNNLISIETTDTECKLSNQQSKAHNKKSTTRIGHINAQSCRNKTDLLKDLILEENVDIMFITETWLSPDGDHAIISDLVPHDFTIKSFPRVHRRGGGIAVIYRKSLEPSISIKTNNNKHTSFENLEIIFSSESSSFQINCIYRPPYSKKNKITFTTFLHEFGILLTESSISDPHPIFIGDFHIQYDSKSNDINKIKDMITHCAMEQLVNEPTHTADHIID